MLNRLSFLLRSSVGGGSRRLGRRVTKAGLLVVGGLLLTASLGVQVGQTVALQAFSFLLALLLVAYAWLPFLKGSYSVRRVLPKFGTAGIPLRYQVVVVNHAKKVQSGIQLMEDLTGAKLSYQEFLQARARGLTLFSREPRRAIASPRELPVLLPGQATEFEAELLPLQRGYVHFEAVTLARTDPLGLLRSFTRVRVPQSVLALPRRYALPPVALLGAHKYNRGGVAMASSVGESEEFLSLRDYRHGDPPRHIHWKSWARVGRPIVKEFQDEFFMRYALILDTFGSTRSDDQDGVFEEAVSIAASFVCTVDTQESLLDLMFVGTTAYSVTVGRGVAHPDQMLEILATAQLCYDKPFSTLAHLVRDHAGLLSGCICIFLTWDEARQQLMRDLRSAGLPVLVMVVAPAGGAAGVEPGPLIDDPRHFVVLESGRIEAGLLSLYGRVR